MLMFDGIFSGNDCTSTIACCSVCMVDGVVGCIISLGVIRMSFIDDDYINYTCT